VTTQIFLGLAMAAFSRNRIMIEIKYTGLTMQPLPDRDLRHILERGRRDLEALDGARLFVSGGTGFLGRWLLESWALARSEGLVRGELVALTRDPARWSSFPFPPGLSFLGGDQAGFPFPPGPFDAVIHGAVAAGSSASALWNNLLGCRRMLDLARGAGAARFLFLSSGAVYGPTPPERVPETWPGAPDPLDPTQAYGAAKRGGEALGAACQAEGGPGFVSARCFAFVGPGLPLGRNYAIGNFIRDALGGGPIRVQGDGAPLRSYLYGADAAVWFWGLLARGRAGAAYNVGSAEPCSILQLARRVRDLLAPEAEVQVAGRPAPGQLRAAYLPDTARAEQELGLRALVDLDEGILRTAGWCREGGGPWG
jgi:dTDP-glucose 4,6-dehydratase